ncbi:hypothetical protein VCR4J5_280003 [Vibrio crassostreae]|uniref:DDE family transposase n=1 Tax=Vibrio crassostreae TaxID=246167 RepID=A0ABP1X3T7_9VIBR|nr:hypothetical protein VCR19J5_110003 [Vibrio crassostreae]CDT43082.1 hypothetical protein VCR4J5_280003 [Vibrio crassostreae]
MSIFYHERHHLKWCRSATWEMVNSLMGRFRPKLQTQICPKLRWSRSSTIIDNLSFLISNLMPSQLVDRPECKARYALVKQLMGA